MRGMLFSLVPAAALFPAAATAGTRANWDKSEQGPVQRARILTALPDGSFHGGDSLTADQFNAALSAFAGRLHRKPVTPAAGQNITVALFHRLRGEQGGPAAGGRRGAGRGEGGRLRPPA